MTAAAGDEAPASGGAAARRCGAADAAGPSAADGGAATAPAGSVLPPPDAAATAVAAAAGANADADADADADATAAAAARLGALLRRRGWRLASAESCTGGLVAAACTALAGSSDWFDRGWVTYANDAKVESLGVPASLIAAHGAVSEAVACAMAAGALARSRAQLAVAVTGIAGPGGAAPGKPVGTVWLACAAAGAAPRAERLQLAGDRAAVRARTVRIALERLADLAASA